MSVSVTITKCNPSPNPATIEKGKTIHFMSTDETYTIEPTSGYNSREISHDWGLRVPNDGQKHSFAIRDHAPKDTYGYIIMKDGSQCSSEQVPPEMIVK
jgi:hypothetical protein